MNRKKSLGLSLSLFLSSAPAWAQNIDRVVVLADRAEVTRVGSARCENGRAQLQFSGLPESVDARTLRGEARAPAQAVGTTSSWLEHEDALSPRAKIVEEALEKVSKEMAGVSDQLTELGTRQVGIDRLESVLTTVMSEGVRNPDPDRAGWMRALESLGQERRTFGDERAKLDARMRELGREQRRLSLELQALGGGTAKRTLEVDVAVECTGSDEVSGSLSYVVGGARWRPEYDLAFVAEDRSGLGSGRAELTVGAIIEQSTGEDWTGASISLSTSKPKLGSEAPELLPIYVQGYEQPTGKVLVEAQVARPKLASGELSQNQGAESVAIDDKGQSFLLKIPHRVTIKSDGRQSWVPVDVIKTSAESRIVATPKLAMNAFRVAAFKNPAPYPLLEGRIRSYRIAEGRQSFMGESRLKYRGLGEPVEISLGVDDNVRVKRERQKEKDENPGLLSSTRHLRRAYEITLTNQAQGPVPVEIRENFPVSQVADVKVEILGETSAGYQKDDNRGFLTWKVDLPRSQPKKIVLAYVIHLPDDWQVQGR